MAQAQKRSHLTVNRRTCNNTLLRTETAEAYNMKTRHPIDWSQWLAAAAWTMFTVSFILPSYMTMRGFQCALSVSFFWSRAIQGDWASIHYLLLICLNLLMVSSPLLLCRHAPDSRRLTVLSHATLIALALIASSLLLLYPKGMVPYLRVGSFVWAGSFALLYFATLLPHGNRHEAAALKCGTLFA